MIAGSEPAAFAVIEVLLVVRQDRAATGCENDVRQCRRSAPVEGGVENYKHSRLVDGLLHRIEPVEVL